MFGNKKYIERIRLRDIQIWSLEKENHYLQALLKDKNADETNKRH